MNLDNKESKRIPKSAEEKKAFKELKAQEKQQRKEKSLQKSVVVNNINIEADKIPSVSTSSNKKEKNSSESKLNSKVDNKQAKPSPEEKVNNNVEPVQKISIQKSSNEGQKQKILRVTSSDRVSFSESSIKHSLNISDEKFSKQTKSDENVVRKQDSKQISYFSHLFNPNRRQTFDKIISEIPDSKIHPAIKKFGSDLDSFKIRGSTNRCVKFFEVLKVVINDLPENANKSFSETFSASLENIIEFLETCRPLATTMRTAIDYLKINLSPLNEQNIEKSREIIIEMIDQFQSERIKVAHEGIQNLVVNYIKPDSNILVCSSSEIVFQSILSAWERMKPNKPGSFRIFVVDSFPDFQGGRMIDWLKEHDIPYCRTNLSSVPQIMPEISLVLLGAHSIMPNNNVISSSGSASVANAAKSLSKPVIVCAETYKIDSQNYSNGFEFNELGSPDFLVKQITAFQQAGDGATDIHTLKKWRNANSNITVVDLLYDVIPSILISGIVCELGFVSSSAVSYVSRIKQPHC